MPIQRTYHVGNVETALELYPYEPIDLDVTEWLADRNNIALTAEDGSIALFEWVRPGLYDGHYFFLCRGKEAIELSHRILSELHTNYGVKAIRGFTPIKHKAALWMSRKIGFHDMGEVPTEIGPCTLFLMNLDEHFSREASE
jgi:hypothetical protein